MTNSKAKPCDKCKRRYKTICNDGLCYSCFKFKYGVSPTIKQYGNNEVKEK